MEYAVYRHIRCEPRVPFKASSFSLQSWTKDCRSGPARLVSYVLI
jgi:hypothetical protein